MAEPAAPESFVSRFEAVSSARPSAAAIVEADKSYSYSELADKARWFAGRIAASDTPPDSLIALSFPKSAEYVAAIIGCWMARRAFLPLDPTLPRERARYYLSASGAAALLRAGSSRQGFEMPEIGMRESEPGRLPFDPSAPAYAFFTSGSTGRPKGVLVPHSGFMGLLDAQIDAFRLGHESRSLFYLSMSFDASLSDIGTALACGAELHIAEPERMAGVPGLLEFMRARGITHADIPPALLGLIDPELLPPALETIIIGGEAAPSAAVRALASRLRVVNVYGPTEATVCVSLCLCGPDWDRPLLGQPINGAELRVLNSRQEDVTDGETGELYISGPCLAIGYIGEEDLSRSKFPCIDGKRYYRTGDLVKRSGEELEFAGRADRQFKLRGKLVEPAEIERALMGIEGVERAAAMLRPGRRGEHIIAFFCGSVASEAQLRARLRESLPAWMCPRRLVKLDIFPMTPSGKIDYGKLGSTDAAPPSSSIPIAIDGFESFVAAWRELLDRESLDPLEDIFDAGADSFACLEMAQLASAAGIELELEDIWELRSPRAIWDGLGAGRGRRSIESLREAAGAIDFEVCRDTPVQKGRILLTGAAGNLGSQLLAGALAAGCEEVFCIVRADSDRQALERLENAARRSGLGWPEDWPGRIAALAGDLSLRGFGLGDDRYRQIAETADTVIHSAAEVNFARSFEQLRASNLEATRNVLAFTAEGRVKAAHIISTLAVYLMCGDAPGILKEDLELPSSALVAGGYAQTKLAAEELCRAARAAGARNINIYRLGLLCPPLDNEGAWAEHDPLRSFLRAIRSIRSLPENLPNDAAFDLTPIDRAAAMILDLALSPELELGRDYHIAADTPLSLGELDKAVDMHGYGLTRIDPRRWRAEVNERLEPSAANLACAAVDTAEPPRSPSELFICSGKRFDRAATLRDLRRKELAEWDTADLFGRCLWAADTPGRERLYDAFYLNLQEPKPVLDMLRRLAKGAGLSPGAKVLEAGCGTGRLLPGLMDSGFEVHGCDPSSEFLAAARARCPEAHLFEGRIERLPRADYGLLAAINGPLNYLAGAAELRAAARSCYAALRNGGLLLIDCPNFEYLLENYDASRLRGRQAEIDGWQVSLTSRHEIDRAAGTWTHHDSYIFRRGPVEMQREESYRFEMFAAGEIVSAFTAAGFELETYPGWDAAEPGRCIGPRIIVAGRKALASQ